MKKIILGNSGKVTIVDDEDYDRLSQFSWGLHTKGYAWRPIKVRGKYAGCVLIHREILGFPNCLIDHRDRNKLNNQKWNLREATPSINGHNRKIGKNNTSGTRGIDFQKHRNKWRARIRIDREYIALGYYENIEDAIMARIKAEIKFGLDPESVWK